MQSGGSSVNGIGSEVQILSPTDLFLSGCSLHR